MKATRKLSPFLLIASLCWLAPSQQAKVCPSASFPAPERSSSDSSVKNSKRGFARTGSPEPGAPESGGIREVIDGRYKSRYQTWKKEFLSTDIGRAQWEMYAHHPRLVLTITIAEHNPHGAATGRYKWNGSGELIEATIALGSQIDEGYPSSVYYPVMNALEPFESKQLIGGSVLAATKLAHELGHVMKIAGTPESLYHLQVQLVPVYNKIFLSNGYKVDDPQLVELAKKMGGNPVEIWEDREYWGEANAMLFLRDRVARERFHCKLFNKIKRTVEEYAKGYEERFAEIAKSQGAIYSCSWK
jgi:YD repeat-containing protein